MSVHKAVLEYAKQNKIDIKIISAERSLISEERAIKYDQLKNMDEADLEKKGAEKYKLKSKIGEIFIDVEGRCFETGYCGESNRSCSERRRKEESCKNCLGSYLLDLPADGIKSRDGKENNLSWIKYDQNLDMKHEAIN